MKLENGYVAFDQPVAARNDGARADPRRSSAVPSKTGLKPPPFPQHKNRAALQHANGNAVYFAVIP